MLHELYRKLLTQAKQTTPDLPIGTLTFSQEYTQKQYGDVAGVGRVAIDQFGNMIGFSPVERCSFNGETAWIPLDLVKNISADPFGTGTRSRVTTPASSLSTAARKRSTRRPVAQKQPA